MRITNGGKIFLFRPLTDAAREWFNEWIGDEAQWFGGALVVEHRYVAGIYEALVESGLTVS